MEIKSKLTVTRGKGGIMGKIGEGPSRNMYKGHMEKATGGRFEGGVGGCSGVKMETTVLEQQLKIYIKKRKKKHLNLPSPK